MAVGLKGKGRSEQISLQSREGLLGALYRPDRCFLQTRQSDKVGMAV